jgi:hypothetical protein
LVGRSGAAARPRPCDHPAVAPGCRGRNAQLSFAERTRKLRHEPVPPSLTYLLEDGVLRLRHIWQNEPADSHVRLSAAPAPFPPAGQRLAAEGIFDRSRRSIERTFFPVFSGSTIRFAERDGPPCGRLGRAGRIIL